MSINLTDTINTAPWDLERYGIATNNNSFNSAETLPYKYRLYIKKYNNMVLQGCFRSYSSSGAYSDEWRDIPTEHEHDYTMNRYTQ